jgi:hypothetical protein
MSFDGVDDEILDKIVSNLGTVGDHLSASLVSRRLAESAGRVLDHREALREAELLIAEAKHLRYTGGCDCDDYKHEVGYQWSAGDSCPTCSVWFALSFRGNPLLTVTPHNVVLSEGLRQFTIGLARTMHS